jgi:hypothetical protein
MNALRNCCLILLVLIALQACNTNTKVDAYGFNADKYQRQRTSHIKNVFYQSYWTGYKIYPKNTGAVTVDTTHQSIAIVCDTFRLYLTNDAIKYQSIFTSGLISPKDIYCGIGQTCTERDDLWSHIAGSRSSKGKPRNPGVYSTIDYIKEIKYTFAKPHRRRFVFHVPDNAPSGFAVYLIELTNKKANNKTNLENFIAGATLTFYYKAWMEI